MWERMERALECGAVERAKQLKNAFLRLARVGKRQNIASQIQEGAWEKTKTLA